MTVVASLISGFDADFFFGQPEKTSSHRDMHSPSTTIREFQAARVIQAARRERIFISGCEVDLESSVVPGRRLDSRSLASICSCF